MSDLPAVADVPESAELAAMDDASVTALVEALRSTERATLAAMAPYNRHLAEVRARLAQLATEQRRRERAQHVSKRAAVRQAAKAGEMPSLAAALDEGLELATDTQLAQLRWFLASGGEVGLGFATRPGAIAFTDGRSQRPARTWAEALALHAAGWEPGTPGVPGVRVHLAGSRVERVVSPAEVVVEVKPV